MSSESFRRQLQKEVTEWQAEGLISLEQEQQLADRYQFDQLDRDARDRFVGVLMAIGGVLLGVGVITFVAANWQVIPRNLRMIMLLALLISANGGGFSLWSKAHTGKSRQPWQWRLGHGLLILGAIALGANLALMGQMFHQDGSAFGLCLVWGVGVLAMAYGLQLVSLGVMAILVFSVGFWTVAVDVSGLVQGSLLQFICLHMPLVTGVLFLPLAYQCRSRLLFALTALGVISSFQAIVADMGDRADDTNGMLWAIAVTLPVALLWAYHDALWAFLWAFVEQRLPIGRGPQFSSNSGVNNSGSDSRLDSRLDSSSEPASNSDSGTTARTERLPDSTSNSMSRDSEDGSRRFRPVARAIAFLWLSLVTYGLSFNSWIYSTIDPQQPFVERLAVWSLLLVNPNIVGLGLLAIALWVSLGWPRIGHQWRLTLTDGFILIAIGLMAALIVWHGMIASIGVYGALIFNVLLFLLAAGVMREGLGSGDRKQFWVGLVLLILQILSRVFEYDTGLVVKSMAFLLCGVAIIVIGLWFERYIRTLPTAQQSSL